MPALTDPQLKQLLARLDAREAVLGSEIRALDQGEHDSPSAADPFGQVGDLGERGMQRLRAEMRQAEKERDINELRDIAVAKERMARGVYGECIDCGIDIPLARLQVQPASQRCLACQEKFERTHPVGPRILRSPS
jgi:DnaK suppressor protein